MPIEVAHRTNRRLPVAAFAVVAVGLVAAVLLLDRSARRDARRRTAAELDAVGAMKAAVIGGWSRERLADAQLAASYPTVMRAAAAVRDGRIDPALGPHIHELLGNLADHYAYERVDLLDLDGRVLADWTRPGFEAAPFPPELARRAVAAPGGGAVELTSRPGRDRPTLEAAAPVRSGGRPAAVVAVRASLESIFDEAIQSWPIPSTTANSGLVNPLPGGDAILYVNGGIFPGLRHLRVRRSSANIPAAMAAAGRLGLVEGVDNRGHPVLAIIRPVPGSPWRLVTKMDLAEVYGGARRSLLATVALAAVILAAGGVMLGFWWRADAARTRSEAQLRESRELFRLALAGTHFLWDWDADAGRLTFERALPAGTSRTFEVVEGGFETLLERLVHPDDRAEVRQRLEAHLRGESEVFEVEYRTLIAPLKGTGEPRWLLARGRGSRPAPDGRPRRLTGVVSDVTARRNLRAQLEHSERLASLGTLAAGVAHEINNPLSYVLANLEFAAPRLTAAGVEPSVLEALAEAEDGATRVRDVVRGLRAFSRPGTGPRGPVDVGAEIEAAVRLARNEIRHRARLDLKVGPLPRVVSADHALGQVFLNLLVNAAQAIPDGHAKDNVITVEARTDEAGWARIEVRDTGSGMTPEVLKRVFEPFFTTKRRGAGTGLGLAIAQGIVATAGGRIEVESEIGKGSTLRVLIPPAPEAAPAERPQEAAEAVRPRKLRVLVVDDDPMVARVIARSVGAEHEVVVTNAAAEALARIEAGETFDAVLCDVMMPQMTGVELHQRVAATRPELARRMIFITGGAFTEATSGVLSGLANPLVSKPFQTGQLKAALEKVVRA